MLYRRAGSQAKLHEAAEPSESSAQQTPTPAAAGQAEAAGTRRELSREQSSCFIAGFHKGKSSPWQYFDGARDSRSFVDFCESCWRIGGKDHFVFVTTKLWALGDSWRAGDEAKPDRNPKKQPQPSETSPHTAGVLHSTDDYRPTQKGTSHTKG